MLMMFWQNLPMKFSQHEVEILNQEKPKVCFFSSHSKKKAFVYEMLPKARDIYNKLKMIDKGNEHLCRSKAQANQQPLGLSLKNISL